MTWVSKSGSFNRHKTWKEIVWTSWNGLGKTEVKTSTKQTKKKEKSPNQRKFERWPEKNVWEPNLSRKVGLKRDTERHVGVSSFTWKMTISWSQVWAQCAVRCSGMYPCVSIGDSIWLNEKLPTKSNTHIMRLWVGGQRDNQMIQNGQQVLLNCAKQGLLWIKGEDRSLFCPENDRPEFFNWVSINQRNFTQMKKSPSHLTTNKATWLVERRR